MAVLAGLTSGIKAAKRLYIDRISALGAILSQRTLIRPVIFY
jgi:hypothetical protein